MVGFGLDLAGFSNHRGTVLAEIQAEQSQTKVVLLTGLPFGRRLGDSDLADRLRNETDTLKDLIEIGPIAVDVPIELQGLPLQHVEHVAEPWELTKRPVDEAFDGLAPLASWLGACVARLAAIVPSDLRQKELGVRILETYPAASLRLRFGEHERPRRKSLPTGYRVLNNTSSFKQIKATQKSFDEWKVESSCYR